MIPSLEYFELRADIIVAGEERKEDFGCVVDLGRKCGVCASVELKRSVFIQIFELGRRHTQDWARWSRLGEQNARKRHLKQETYRSGCPRVCDVFLSKLDRTWEEGDLSRALEYSVRLSRTDFRDQLQPYPKQMKRHGQLCLSPFELLTCFVLCFQSRGLSATPDLLYGDGLAQ